MDRRLLNLWRKGDISLDAPEPYISASEIGSVFEPLRDKPDPSRDRSSPREGSSTATITAQDSSEDESACAAFAVSFPFLLFLSLPSDLDLFLSSALRSLDLLGPCPSLLPPLAQHSALMWPFFLQL